ncbi:uncharacterized protein PHACADRAFT_259166 [Phanerochaete carnosa HHB-10118-sp]|uniref:Uncharacterized protein n=1 Tax=Phanerochaete carnosa (strain HHB-10118-sp) TaxID=650164 RepID=K5W275_PHACS|nr:uncharacterized protein PHACADRAFT_259166 [Phanerochaete carnosa HHB-10118-sp]EKM52994.1 hypothetical protein PHACADRAFT_259166 [Phanerochaete carnosa HHB-10118-sp]
MYNFLSKYGRSGCGWVAHRVGILIINMRCVHKAIYVLLVRHLQHWQSEASAPGLGVCSLDRAMQCKSSNSLMIQADPFIALSRAQP